MFSKSYFVSPVGRLTIVVSAEGLLALSFGDSWSDAVVDDTHVHVLSMRETLTNYFAGKGLSTSIPLHPQGTDFQKKVWDELQRIPYGTTISYAQLAKRLGDEKVIRAAATANGANPIAILIPCHRVIGSDGSMTGYAGGVENKIWLLQHEGAMLF